jgi:hypothetical protein
MSAGDAKARAHAAIIRDPAKHDKYRLEEPLPQRPPTPSWRRSA